MRTVHSMVGNGPVYQLWLSRNDEPADLDPIELLGDGQYGINEDAIEARQLWELAECSLTKREASILLLYHVMGCSIDYIASKAKLTPARIRQIERRAVRKARRAMSDHMDLNDSRRYS